MSEEPTNGKTNAIIEVARIVERQKTLRVFWIGFFIVVGLGILTTGVVMALDEPPWLTALLAIIASLVGPSGVISLVIKARQKYVNKTHRRTVDLEKQLDPNRESSGPRLD